MLLVVISTAMACGASQSPGVGAELPQPRLVLKLSADSNDMAYDPVRNAVWLAESSAPNYLDRFDASSGHLTRFLLPTSEYAGPDSQVKVDANGNVWMSEGYNLIRLDIATDQISWTTLSVNDPDALSGAFDATLGGTWITGIGVAGDALLIARRNVGAIVRLDKSFKEIARFPISSTFAGATDINVDQSGRIALLGGYAVGKKLALLAADGQLIQTIDLVGHRLVAAADRMVISDGRDNGAIVTSNAGGLAVDRRITARTDGSLAAPDPTGGEVLYDRRTGVIERVDRGTVLATYTIPQTLIYPRGGGARPYWVRLQVMAVTVDVRGDIWFVMNGTNEVQEIVAA